MIDPTATVQTHTIGKASVKITASIEEPAVIKTILPHLEKTSRTPAMRISPPAARAPPQASHPGPTDQAPHAPGTDAESFMLRQTPCRATATPTRKIPRTSPCHSRFRPDPLTDMAISGGSPA
jgi:hypothetical protein